MKLDLSGNFVWVRHTNGRGATGMDVVIDRAGDIYVAGKFQFAVDFDPGVGVLELQSPGGSDDAFVLKLDEAGNLVWVEALGVGVSAAVAEAIALDQDGNVHTTGQFLSTADFHPGPELFELVAPDFPATEIFLAKLESATRETEPTPTPIPAIGPYAMTLLVLVLSGFAVVTIRSR